MKAIILSIGDEVLSGKVVNTNASYLAMELEGIGATPVKHVTVGDDREKMSKELDEFMNSDCDILITTGGLGPTHDDFTKELISERLGYSLELNSQAKEILDNYFKGEYPECNLKQANFPKEAIIIPNKNGTACGMILEKNDKIIIVLVGPPHELKPMVTDTVLPYLISKDENKILIKNYYLMGISESKMEQKLIEYYPLYPNVNIAPYASLEKIRVQVTSRETYKDEFNRACNMFEGLFNEYIIGTTLEPIEVKVVNELKRLKMHISTAESCTGGMISSSIVNVSGSSSVFNESVITYSNEAKIKYLDVNPNTINKYGVVSEEVVTEMVNGLQKLTSSEVCIGVSGIAGPTGGTKEKPVGLVHFAIKVCDKVYTFSSVFRGDRDAVRKRTNASVLYNLFMILKTM